MENFKVFSIDGEVLDYTRNTHTEISSSGGGGYVFPEWGGHVSAPTIESTVIKEDNFWMKTTGGREIHISLKNRNIPVRPGQRLSLIYVATRNNEGPLAALVNHSSETYWILRSASTFIDTLAPQMFIVYLMALFYVLFGLPEIVAHVNNLFDGLYYPITDILKKLTDSFNPPWAIFSPKSIESITYYITGLILPFIAFLIVPYRIFKKKMRNYRGRIQALDSKIKSYL